MHSLIALTLAAAFLAAAPRGDPLGSPAAFCRAAMRFSDYAGGRLGSYGLRPALDVPGFPQEDAAAFRDDFSSDRG